MKPLKIGITGGMGSGKSIICKVFKELNVPVYEADKESKLLLTTNLSVVNRIKHEFGESIYDKQNNLVREKLSEIVFNDTKKLEILNSIIHPEVKNHFSEWLKVQTSAYIVKEAAIMFESGSHKDLDKIITVYAPEELRIKRIMQRDHSSEEKIRARIKNQMPEEERQKRSDFVIYNDGSQLVLPQILSLHAKFLNSYNSLT